MQKFQRTTRTSFRRPEGIGCTDEQREQPGLVGLLLGAMKTMSTWRSLPFMLFLTVICSEFFCQTNTKAQEGGFWGTVLQNNAASYVVRTDDGWLLDAEWDSGYAWRTLAGYEVIHMIRKGQACGSAPAARVGLLHRFVVGIFGIEV
jgi:hypothetical protein